MTVIAPIDEAAVVHAAAVGLADEIAAEVVVVEVAADSGVAVAVETEASATAVLRTGNPESVYANHDGT